MDGRRAGEGRSREEGSRWMVEGRVREGVGRKGTGGWEGRREGERRSREQVDGRREGERRSREQVNGRREGERRSREEGRIYIYLSK